MTKMVVCICFKCRALILYVLNAVLVLGKIDREIVKRTHFGGFGEDEDEEVNHLFPTHLFHGLISFVQAPSQEIQSRSYGGGH